MTEMSEARLAIRSDKEQLAEQQLRKAYGDNYNAAAMLKCRQEVSRLLNEDTEKQAVMKKVQKQQQIIEKHTMKKRSNGVKR